MDRTTVLVQTPKPYPLQARIINSTKRYLCAEASTKSGKTVGCLMWLVQECQKIPENGNLWWVAPVYAQAEIAFRRLQAWLVKSNVPSGFYSVRESDLKITLLGRHIWFKGSDDPDKLYGDDVHRAVVDEASRCKDEAWPAIRSTLTATRGNCRLIGNVRGRHNWFYKLCREAQSGDNPQMEYVRILASDAVAAGVFPQSELDDAKRNLEATGHGELFRELYFCEPAQDGGNPFGYEFINQCVERCPAPSAKPIACYGIDLGKSIDYTWVIGLDEDGNQAYSRRWQADWDSTFRDIRSIVGSAPALIDSTGVGDPIAEQLMKFCPMMDTFKFTALSKQRLMENLRAQIHQGLIGFCDKMLILELESFEYEERKASSRQGAVKYCAAPGCHDDGVVALALAVYCLRDPDIVTFNIWQPRAMITVG